jgi:hypothetical protein
MIRRCTNTDIAAIDAIIFQAVETKGERVMAKDRRPPRRVWLRGDIDRINGGTAGAG